MEYEQKAHPPELVPHNIAEPVGAGGGVCESLCGGRYSAIGGCIPHTYHCA